jgi:hypothetical protein
MSPKVRIPPKYCDKSKAIIYFHFKVQNHISIVANHTTLRVFATNQRTRGREKQKNTKDDDYTFVMQNETHYKSVDHEFGSFQKYDFA